jgi:hypothetical protein
MSELFPCPDCGRHYRADKLKECPGCGDVSTSQPKTPSRSFNHSIDSRTYEVSNQELLIQAQDRTTYAIRSLALFFFTAASTSIIGFSIYYFNLRGVLNCGFDSYCIEGYSGWQDVGPTIAGIGLLAAIAIGINEVRASKL